VAPHFRRMAGHHYTIKNYPTNMQVFMGAIAADYLGCVIEAIPLL